MRLLDLRIDEEGGIVYVEGRLRLGAVVHRDGEPLGVRLDDGALLCHAVSGLTRLENGFHRAEERYPHFGFTLLTRSFLQDFLYVGDSYRANGRFVGGGLGSVWDPTPGHEADPEQPIERLDFDALLDEQGLHLTLRGVLGACGTATPSALKCADQEFEVEAVVPWPFLILRELFWWARDLYLHGPKSPDPAA